MSNPELLAKLQQLSRAEKFQIMQFLTAELAKEEGINIGNEAAEIGHAVHTYNGASEQLMQLLKTEQKQAQNV
jgi:thioredoxin-like negative regulator of GroEL